MSRRAGVLGLMLHSTFNHALLDERYKAQRREQLKQQQLLQQQALTLQQKAAQVRQKVSANNYAASSREFPLASSYSGIVHHLSGPNVYALAPPHPQWRRDGPVVRPAPRTGILPRTTERKPFTFITPLGFVEPNDSRTC